MGQERYRPFVVILELSEDEPDIPLDTAEQRLRELTQLAAVQRMIRQDGSFEQAVLMQEAN